MGRLCAFSSGVGVGAILVQITVVHLHVCDATTIAVLLPSFFHNAAASCLVLCCVSL